MLPKQINNPYFDVAFKGAQSAACDLGGALTEVGPSSADATLQIPFIQTATTQGAKAILVSADDANVIAPALKSAMAAGIKVVGYDSSPAVGAYNVFVNQADTAGIGKGLADMACDEAPSCTGEIAVLSAAQTATNQNAWIAAMKTTLTGSKYAGLKLDGVYSPEPQSDHRANDRWHRRRGAGRHVPESDRQGLCDRPWHADGYADLRQVRRGSGVRSLERY
jgi:rhamnose transport system substrate-binding protein